MQWNKIQGLIQKGVDEGATLVTGGLGKPEGLETGYYREAHGLRQRHHDMTIAKEEIFGPVLAILGYDGVDQAVEIGNDTRVRPGRLCLGHRPVRGPRRWPRSCGPAR